MKGMEKRENIEWLDMIMVMGMGNAREKKKMTAASMYMHVRHNTTNGNQSNRPNIRKKITKCVVGI